MTQWLVSTASISPQAGALKHYTEAQKNRELSLYPGEWRHLVCSLGVEAIV